MNVVNPDQPVTIVPLIATSMHAGQQQCIDDIQCPHAANSCALDGTGIGFLE